MSERIAIWRTLCGLQYIELVKKGGQYLLNASPGTYIGDHPTFLSDEDAIYYVDRQVRNGSFDPSPLVWRRE